MIWFAIAITVKTKHKGLTNLDIELWYKETFPTNSSQILTIFLGIGTRT